MDAFIEWLQIRINEGYSEKIFLEDAFRHGYMMALKDVLTQAKKWAPKDE